MDSSFFAYLQQLEMMAFFSGYPLIYTITIMIFKNQKQKGGIRSRIVSLLPFAYALVGTLFLGLQLKNLYPDFSIENISGYMQSPYLKIWGLLSLLFWIPALAKKTFFSLLHSLVFFLILVKDLFLHTFQFSTDENIIRNEMKIYSDSLILNLGALAVVILIYILLTRMNIIKKSS